MHAFALFASALALALPIAHAYAPQGTILSPTNGTVLAPGQAFPFSYDIRADYCTSSFNYTVWLFTSDPADLGMGANNVIGTGRFLGRFQQENYPGVWLFLHNSTSSAHDERIAVPYPKNPPPADLVMPDFSRSPGGFADGMSASNKAVYLAVLEEWNDCSVRPTIF
jgi:hypothetical protein